jgi:hypothetical protein
LEADRGSVLIIDAAVRGVVDFREARLEDPAWWRRLRTLVDGMVRERDRAIYQAMYDMKLALVANGRLTDESWENARDSASDLKQDIIATYRPWLGRDLQDRQKKEFKTWRQKYIDAFGVDPNDEKFQEWEAATIRDMEKVSAETETEEARVTRKLLERLEGTEES